jgi:hypothetical protein
LNSAMGPVVIVLLDPVCDRGSRFLHVAVLCGPHFFFLQTAMKAFDITVSLRVIIGRASMGDSQAMQCFYETRGSELGSVAPRERGGFAARGVHQHG